MKQVTPGGTVATVSDCSTPSPTCRIIDFGPITTTGLFTNRVQIPIKSEAQGAGFEIRVTLLSANVTLDTSTDPVVINSRLVMFDNVKSNYYGTFLSTDNVGQAVFCDENCEIRQIADDGSIVVGGEYSVQVEIFPVVGPCTGCTLTCDDTFTSGCLESAGSNCATIVRTPVTSDISMTCTAGGGANKIRVYITDQAGILCETPNCNEKFLLDSNYMQTVQYNGQVIDDDVLLPITSLSIDLMLTSYGGTRFTLRLLAVNE